jgi:dihydrodipicolinate synthase/N-acetylneuraminate lyase
MTVLQASDIGGVYPILFAYFDREERLHEANMRRQVRACLDWKVDGIAALGLATEVGKLSTQERRDIINWVCEEAAGKLPVAITVAEPSVHTQIELARHAIDCGAGWLILQPPPIKNLAEIEYMRFFGRIADAIDAPIAIQNAQEYIGISLSNAGLKELNRQHPNICVLKAEGPSTYVRQLMDATDGAFRVFNGRGGLEFTENIRAGCVGMIPAPESADVQAAILRLMHDGSPHSLAEAERLYAEILPLITFLIQSVENFLCYGKRIFAKRAGFEDVFDRAPAVRPVEWGTAAAHLYADKLDGLLCELRK